MSNSQYVTFWIDNYFLGLPVEHVREVNRHLTITPVQHVPEHVMGLMNLRGQVITVFDLAVRIGLPPMPISAESHNVILKEDLVGLVVGAIDDVVDGAELQMKPVPANLSGISRQFVKGVYDLPKTLLVILDTERVLELARQGNQD